MIANMLPVILLLPRKQITAQSVSEKAEYSTYRRYHRYHHHYHL